MALPDKTQIDQFEQMIHFEFSLEVVFQLHQMPLTVEIVLSAANYVSNIYYRDLSLSYAGYHERHSHQIGYQGVGLEIELLAYSDLD